MFTRKGIAAALLGAVGIAGVSWVNQAEAGPQRVQRAWRNYMKEVQKDPCDDDVAKKWKKIVKAQQESAPFMVVTPGVVTTPAPAVIQPQTPAVVPEVVPPTPDRGSGPQPRVQPRDVRRNEQAAPRPSAEKEPPPVPKEPEAADDDETSSPPAR